MRSWLIRPAAFAVTVFAAAFFFAEPAGAAPLTFTVISAGDYDDSSPGDGLCRRVIPGDIIITLPCSLRAAITEANAHAGADTIAFDIGNGGIVTIAPASPLPQVTEQVVIDGTTQPNNSAGTPPHCAEALGRPCIVLNGANAGGGAEGLYVLSGATIIKGLAVHSFSGTGVQLVDGPANILTGNWVGTSDGTSAAPNAVGISAESSSNIIGGSGPGDRNVISGNNGSGLVVTGGSTNNHVYGNFIGTTADGTAALGNGLGVQVISAINTVIGGGSGTTPGGACTGVCNVISGSTVEGIEVNSGASGTIIQGNFIGVNAAGTAPIGNGFAGIQLALAGSVTIGSTSAAGRNVISGNGIHGIHALDADPSTIIHGNYIGTNSAGTAAIGNDDYGVFVFDEGILIGGDQPGQGNLISGNGIGGIDLLQAKGASVQGNIIGLNAAGDAAVPNVFAGIIVSSSTRSTIGGESDGARNVISGNGMRGIRLSTNLTGQPEGTSVLGNYIGTDVTGEADVGNAGPGVEIAQSSQNTIGSPQAGNVISGNGPGVLITNELVGLTAENNVVSGNIIGLDKDGETALPNTGNGVSIQSGPGTVSDNTVGGAGPGAGNVISGNAGNGVDLRTTGGTVDNNMVLGNLIGTDAAALNGVGNNFFGVFATAGATNTTIDSNTIAANSVGVRIGDPTTVGTQITSNFIGTNAAHDEGLGNLNEGVYLSNAQLTTIGGVDAGNTIWNNGAAGVRVQDSDAISNPISRNSIDDNAGEGIELNAGGNEEQSPPTLTSAENGSTRIEGTFTGDPDTTYKIEFFASPQCDPSGSGEGRTFLGDLLLLTDGTGAGTIDVTLPPTTPAGDVVTSTATSPTANTSEFSNCVTVTGSATPTPTLPATPTPTGSATPTPSGSATPTPTGSVVPVQGDADCDGDADLDDMMAVLAFLGGVGPEPPCADQANADCDDAIDADDALLIALYVADVPAPASPPCPPVGT